MIVPVRDRRELLARCLAALAGQDHPSFEVVVVDVGSTDGSLDDALRFAAADPRVRVVRNTGSGAVAARTAGVAEARGRYLAFTDSDCEPDPTWLRNGTAHLTEGAAAVGGRTIPTGPHHRRERTLYVIEDHGLYPTCNMLYRRDAYEAAGGFDATAADRLGFRQGSHLRGLGFGEDTLLAWRIARTGPLVFDPDVLVRHAVLPADSRDAVRRSWAIGGFPALVREVPELRRTLLRHRLFLATERRIPFDLALLLVFVRRPRLAALAALVWAVPIARRSWREGGDPARRARTAAADLAEEAAGAVALLVGSVRTRTPVL